MLLSGCSPPSSPGLEAVPGRLEAQERFQDDSVQTRAQVHQRLGERLASHLSLDNQVPQLLKGPCDEVALALYATGRLAAGMGMDQVRTVSSRLCWNAAQASRSPYRLARHHSSRREASPVSPTSSPMVLLLVPMHEKLNDDMTQPSFPE